MTEDEMVGLHHRLKGHESEQTPGDSEEQGILACCSPWGCKESDTTEQLNNKRWCLAKTALGRYNSWVVRVKGFWSCPGLTQKPHRLSFLGFSHSLQIHSS